MWSRGHKARGQGHKTNPRPRQRTALPTRDTLEAKNRGDRGQGQGPRTQIQEFSKKTGLLKNFSGHLQTKRSRKNFSADLQTFNHSKNSALLEPRTRQFSGT